MKKIKLVKAILFLQGFYEKEIVGIEFENGSRNGVNVTFKEEKPVYINFKKTAFLVAEKEKQLVSVFCDLEHYGDFLVSVFYDLEHYGDFSTTALEKSMSKILPENVEIVTKLA